MTLGFTDIGTTEDMAIQCMITAHLRLREAHLLYENSLENAWAVSFDSAANRAYYAAFSAIIAVRSMKGEVYRRHRATISAFNKEYVAAGVFPREMGKDISRLEKYREISDYDFGKHISKEEIEESLGMAGYIIEAIETYLEETYEGFGDKLQERWPLASKP